jgi:hypothetical protein
MIIRKAHTVDVLHLGLEAAMTDKKPAPMKDRKDIGEVVFPIEKLTAARAASSSCVHIEAVLESDSGLINLIKNRPHSAVMGKDPK